MRTLAKETVKKAGKSVVVKGWVHNRRDHGGLIFIDLRDHTGIVQLVIQPENAAAFHLAEQLRGEFVISATGEVTERAANLRNPQLETGNIEIKVSELTILNHSEPLPFQISDEENASEEVRLKYRFLDLRRQKMQLRLKQRADYYKELRKYMDDHDFVEVTTPILANSSPEGARDFLVPSRVHAGKYYALPQAPQQFKQLLMVGGVPKYYQIATCFRDEDPRADRLYGDFYQLDLEMSFIEDGEEIRSEMEPLIRHLATEFAGKKLLDTAFPRLTYKDAMDRYGSDKPDLRFGLELVDVSDVFANTAFSVFANALQAGGVVKAIAVPSGAKLTRSQIDQFTDIAKSEGAGGLAYIMYENGEVKSPITKFFSQTELEQLKGAMGVKDGDAVFFAADMRGTANKVLGRLRSAFADHFELKDNRVIAAAWIVDFPFYEWDDKTQKVDFGHNPFSMPKGGLQVFDGEKSSEQLLEIVADQFDLVMNGYEVCSGAVRNFSPEVMYRAFGAIGYDRAHVDEKFGAMINAFKYGAPPHGGCAFGLDRIFMVLTDETNIREVVAFPKNGSGVDLMMNSPSRVDEQQLAELHIKEIAE